MSRLEKCIFLLAGLHIAISAALLFITVRLALAIGPAVRHGIESADDLLTILLAYIWLPQLGAIGLVVCFFFGSMSLLLLVASWGLMRRTRWGQVMTMLAFGLFALPFVPAAVVTLVPKNASIATIMFNVIVLYSLGVIVFLCLPPVHAAIAQRVQMRRSRAVNHPPVWDSMLGKRARGRAERARDRAHSTGLTGETERAG